MPQPLSPVVSTEWLQAHLDDPDLRIVDVRWTSKVVGGRGAQVDDPEGYRAGHIPGAVFLGIEEELSEPGHPVPNMLVNPQGFAQVMGRLGIDGDSLVVAYDGNGLPQASARLWWALNRYGHDRVVVLDGGWRQWAREGRPVSTAAPAVAPRRFTPVVRPEWVADKTEMAAASRRGDSMIISALPPELHTGQSVPWGGRGGHIPGSVNIPGYANLSDALAQAPLAVRPALLDAAPSWTFRPEAELSEIYRAAIEAPDRRCITYCGSGFAASASLLVLRMLGCRNARLYDGSWFEWSRDLSLPGETGPGR